MADSKKSASHGEAIGSAIGAAVGGALERALRGRAAKIAAVVGVLWLMPLEGLKPGTIPKGTTENPGWSICPAAKPSPPGQMKEDPVLEHRAFPEVLDVRPMNTGMPRGGSR